MKKIGDIPNWNEGDKRDITEKAFSVINWLNIFFSGGTFPSVNSGQACPALPDGVGKPRLSQL